MKLTSYRCKRPMTGWTDPQNKNVAPHSLDYKKCRLCLSQRPKKLMPAPVKKLIRPTSREPSSDLPFEVNTKSVLNWIQGLQIDAHRTWKLIYSALQALNKTSCDPHLKRNILETFRPVIFVLSSKLQTYISRSNFPLDPKQRKIAKLSVKIHTELATGYRQIATSDTFDRNFTQEQQTWIIHRAIQSLSLSLLRTAQMYEPFSSRIWSKLNELYQAAESKGLTDTIIDENQHPFDSKSSIGSIFKRTALFAVMNPHRLTQQEMADTFRILDRVSDDAKLSSDIGKSSHRASLYIDLQSNRAPFRITQTIHRNSYRYLFTQKLGQTLTRLNEQETSNSGSTNYIAKLVPYFGNFSSKDISGERKRKQLIRGFDPICSFLSKSKPSFALKQDNSLGCQNWLKVPDLDLLPLEDENPTLGSKRTVEPQSEFYRQSIAPKNNGKKSHGSGSAFDDIQCYSARLNVDGFYLLETDTVLETGEIIGVWSAQEPMQIGVIRWEQKTGHKEQFQYGIELLGSKALSVSASFDANQQVKLLLLQNNPNGIPIPSILLPPVKYRCGTVFTVKVNRKTRTFQIQKLSALNETFCQYSIAETTE